jgi:hypothetical protein
VVHPPRTPGPDFSDLRESWPVYAQNSFSACGRNTRIISPNDAASKPFVESKARYIRLEDPQMCARTTSSCRKLIGGVSKEPLTYSMTTCTRVNVKIVYEASPDGIEVTITADKRLHAPGRVTGNTDELTCGMIAEPLAPDGEPVSFDIAAQEFRCKNV